MTTTTSPSTAAAQDVTDALLCRMQVPLARFEQGRVALDYRGRPLLRTPTSEALSLASAPLVDLAEIYLRRVGGRDLRIALAKMGRPAIVQLAMSRGQLMRYFPAVAPRPGITLAHAAGDFPGLLADAMGKAISTQYAIARRTWRAWARRVEIDDFKERRALRVEDASLPRIQLDGGDIEFAVVMASGGEVYRLATYAQGAALTRRTLLNDDLAALRNIATGFTQAAARLEDSLAYGVLEANAAMADEVELFHTDHSNLVTGALTGTSYAAARAKMQRQAAADGSPLDLAPAALIVPPELAGAAEAVLADAARAPRALGETVPAIVESPFLSNVTMWYLSTGPERTPAAEVAFLRESPEPVITEEVAFESDNVRLRCRHDVAARAIDHRAIVRSSGE